jgi:hypothetical protein
VTLKKISLLPLDSRTFPTVQFRNKIVPGTFYSSEFTVNGRRYQYTDYNPNNNTFTTTQVDNKIVVTNSSTIVYLKDVTVPASITYTNAGTINYEDGIASMNSIVITDFLGRDGIEFYAKPESEDVISRQNDILAIDIESIQVTVRAA